MTPLTGNSPPVMVLTYEPNYLPTSFCGVFEVHFTIAILGLWDHNVGNYGGLYSTVD